MNRPIESILIELRGAESADSTSKYMGTSSGVAFYVLLVPEEIHISRDLNLVAQWLLSKAIEALAIIGQHLGAGKPNLSTVGRFPAPPMNADRIASFSGLTYDRPDDVLVIIPAKNAAKQRLTKAMESFRRGPSINRTSIVKVVPVEPSTNCRSKKLADFDFSELDTPMYLREVFESPANQLLVYTQILVRDSRLARGYSLTSAIEYLSSAAGLRPRVAGRDSHVLWCALEWDQGGRL